MNEQKHLTYGHCPRCKADYTVKKDGTLRSHTNRDARDTKLPFSTHCDGSGTKPSGTFVWPWPLR